MRRVLFLVNRKAGLPRSFGVIRSAMDRHWDVEGVDLSYQFCQSVEDGIAKAQRAVSSSVDTILVAGGDGTVSSIGRVLIGSDVQLGIIPTGSGNGFARHFEIPLDPSQAVAALAEAVVKKIDVGVVSGIPFLVTCSMAWDAALVESFQKSPIRGIVPYIFAGVHKVFDYEPQDIEVILDDEERVRFRKPMVFTIANLTQYGGGALIAPHAAEDDGRLELVVVSQQDLPMLVANILRLFDGSIRKMPQVVFKRFKRMTLKRDHAAKIQIDGELADGGCEINVRVLQKALNVLVPQTGNKPL